MTNGSKQTGSAASPDRSAVADEKLKLNLRPVFKRVDPLWPGIGFELFYSTGAWLIGPFVEAWVRVNGESDDAKREARTRFLMPIMEHLNHAGLGHVSEIADADLPHTPRGCPFQAWSVGEALRLDRIVLALSERKEIRASSRARAASKDVSTSSAALIR